MTKGRRSVRSAGQTRRLIDEITNHHTSRMLQRKRSFESSRSGQIDPEKVAERRHLLEQLGLLPGLEENIQYNVLLPGNTKGVASGITTEGFVIVQGWNSPFNPKAIKTQRPLG